MTHFIKRRKKDELRTRMLVPVGKPLFRRKNAEKVQLVSCHFDFSLSQIAQRGDWQRDLNIRPSPGYRYMVDQSALTESARDGGQALRQAFGPSPWGFPARFTSLGQTLSFVETAPGDPTLSGMMSLQDSNGATLLLVDFYCYIRILHDGTTLLWQESGEKTARRIGFDCFPIPSLQPVSDPLTTAAEIRKNKLGIASLPGFQRWQFCPYMEAGIHAISVPYNWSQFEETLVLADYSDVADKPSRAIFAFNWAQGHVEVLPQDWFNNGDYDFGYQWITRVARRGDGSIVGDGIRLGRFELDETNRQIKRWLSSESFYMIQGSVLQS